MLKVWNLSLIVGTFALTVLGTFLTRGSILASVHAFADSIVGPLYLVFLTVVLLEGSGRSRGDGVAARRGDVRHAALARERVPRQQHPVAGAHVHRPGRTIYPLLAEAVTGGEVSVGSPFFNRNTVPVALLLLFLMGIGPCLPWRAARCRRGPSPPAGPDVGRRHHRGISHLRGRGWPRWSCSGSRRSSRRRPSPRWFGACRRSGARVA